VLDEVDVEDLALSTDVGGGLHDKLVIEELLGAEKLGSPAHAEGVVDDHVNLVLAEGDLNVLERDVNMHGSVLTELLLEDLDVLAKRRRIKLEVLDQEHLVPSVLVDREFANVRGSDSI